MNKQTNDADFVIVNRVRKQAVGRLRRIAARREEPAVKRAWLRVAQALASARVGGGK